MSLQIVYGPSGSGKSTLLQNEMIDLALKNPKRQFLLIVPDQFTMQTQMDIVKKHPNGGIMNIDVLSFSRLSYRVFSETGRPDYAVLDDTGKSLVLRHVASMVADKMPYIGSNLNKIGYIHEVKSMISEFMQYGLSVKDVEKLSDSLEAGLLKTKLKDLNVIYEAFCTYNKDRFITSEETLDILCNKLSETEFIKDSYVVFDGFTGFTPIQERVILRLLELANKVTVTLTLSSPEKPGEIAHEEKLFYLTRNTGNRLTNFAKQRGILVLEPILLNQDDKGRFSNNLEIAHLEKNLFRFPFDKFNGKNERIEIFKTADIESEVAEISLRIHDLVRTGNYAYRDIAVVVGDLSSYGDSFATRMKELNIPCFIDRTTGIVLNPFLEYLKSALQIIIKDYSYDSVFHYLKSGFTDFDEDAIDRFSRYIDSLNIRGKNAYSKSFTKLQRGMKKDFAEKELELHEETRSRFVEEMALLDKPSKTAGDYVRNLYAFLTNNKSYEKLRSFELKFEEENNLAKAREYGQIYRLIMELLDTIDHLIGDEEMDINEFYKIFDAGIMEIEVGTIPKNVDRVVIGDIERTRLNEVKVLFFAGVNDGNIPRVSDSSGILSNSEREVITAKQYDLSPTDQMKMYTQRLYLYMNLCKPTDRLFISYSSQNSEGKGLKPSYLIQTLTKLFPNLTVNDCDNSLRLERIVNLRDSYRFYSDLVNKYSIRDVSDYEKKLTECLLNLYRSEEEALECKITDAAFTEYAATAISKEIVKLIYDNTIAASISRMEKYANCAYAHFLKYGMELHEKADANFASRDLGNVYHGILDIFSAKLGARNLSFETFTKEEGKEIIAEAVNEYCEEYEQGLLLDDEQTQYIIYKITKIMERTIDTIQFQLKRGKFSPTMYEYPFVREIPLDEGSITLKGRIDRIDLYEDKDRVYVRIIDYKSGSRSLDITNIYLGLEQQLPLYMAEMIHHEKQKHPDKDIIPAACFYYKIDNPFIDVKGYLDDDSIEHDIRKELKFEGILSDSEDVIEVMDEDASKDAIVLPVSFTKSGLKKTDKTATAEEMKNMLNYTENMVKQIGSRIQSGDISINPMKVDEKKDACMYCEYKSICRFDKKIPGFKERDSRDISKDEAKECVMGGKENGLYSFT